MKKNFLKKDKYPKFKLAVFRDEAWHYYTSNLKSRIVARLRREKKATRAYFVILYDANNKKNTSITYELPKQLNQLKKDWAIFSAKSETDFLIK